MLGIPILYEALLNCHDEKDLDLSILINVVSGRDMISNSIEDKVIEFLKEYNSRYKIAQGYDLSVTLASICLAPDDANKSGSNVFF